MTTAEQTITTLCQQMLAHYEHGHIAEAIAAGEAAWGAAIAAWGEHDLRVAEVSHNLGELYRLQGRFRDALVAGRRAVAAREAPLAPDHPLFANSLETIGKIEEETEDLAAAVRTYERVLQIRRAHRDASELPLAETLGNAGVLQHRLGNDAEALAQFREAREIFVRLGATGEWAYAAVLTNEASALRALGRWAAAEAALAEVLGRYEDGHPRSASVLADLAELYREQGKLELAEDVHRRLQRIADLHGPVTQDIGIVQGNLGLLYGDQGRYPEALQQLRQSAAFDDTRLADVFALASGSNKLAQARAIQGHVYALLTLLRDHVADSAELASTLVLRRKALVQDAVARGRSSLLRRATTRDAGQIDTHALRSALPAGAVLIDYVKYAPYRFGHYPGRGESRWGAPRYLAIVVPADRERAIDLIDLGEAAAIDEQVVALQYAFAGGRDAEMPDRAPEGDPCRAAERLRKTVLDPFAERLRGIPRLYVAPDGELSLVPFGVFPTGDDRYLVDDHVIAYLTSGRDLLRSGEPASSAIGPPVVIADPDYDLRATSATATGPARGSFRPLHLRRLPGTRAEGLEIAKQLGIKPLLDDAAVVGTIKKLRSPRVLHLATHGLFLSRPDDPMRRSGLALAGANTWSNGGAVPSEAEDGILDAEDVSALDLAGTELVVLSACDTARGEVHSGEGVFGLRRAFVLAGVQSLVMSLWKVDDDRTKELMIELYQLLGEHDPAAALTHAQRRLKRAVLDPGTWGAFICQSASSLRRSEPGTCSRICTAPHRSRVRRGGRRGRWRRGGSRRGLGAGSDEIAGDLELPVHRIAVGAIRRGGLDRSEQRCARHRHVLPELRWCRCVGGEADGGQEAVRGLRRVVRDDGLGIGDGRHGADPQGVAVARLQPREQLVEHAARHEQGGGDPERFPGRPSREVLHSAPHVPDAGVVREYLAELGGLRAHVGGPGAEASGEVFDRRPPHDDIDRGGPDPEICVRSRIAVRTCNLHDRHDEIELWKIP